MSTSRPFAYNPSGTPISGTEQVGDIAIGTPDVGFESTGLEWWNGPDEELGYVICRSVPGDTQHTPVPGVSASVKFIRSTDLTDGSYVELVNSHFSQNFSTVNQANTFLSGNYWTSYSSFGSSGFQWMTINSITSNNAAGVGQNAITISITQSGGGMGTENGMYSAGTFPQEYGVPLSGPQIQNNNSGIFTAVFSQPVFNPLVAFSSVGNGSLSVPVIVSKPFTPIWSQSTTFQSPTNSTQYTQFTGTEGFTIIRIDGTASSVSFNYTVSESYSTICFGFVNQNV